MYECLEQLCCFSTARLSQAAVNDPTTAAPSISIASTFITTTISCDRSHVHAHVVAVGGTVREEGEDPIGKGVGRMEGGSGKVKATVHQHQGTLVCSCLLS